MPEAQSQSTAQVGQIECGLAIAAKGRSEEREECLVLVDWQGLPRAQRPSARCEIEAEGLDHRYKWIRHSHAPPSMSRSRVSPQTPAKAGRLREKRVRGGPARALAVCLVQRRRVSRAWRTTLPTVLSSKKRSRLGRAVCNSSGKPTRLYADSRL